MDEIHDKILRNLRSFLVKNIKPDEEIQDQISDERVFTKQMIERIKAQETPSERCRKMLDILPQRGPNAYDIFLEYLRKSGHGFVADRIIKTEQEYTYGTSLTCSESAAEGQNQSASIGVSQQVTDNTTTKHLAKGISLNDTDNGGTSKPVAKVQPQHTENH
ncbi:death domain-containing protein CRADD-like [Mizuhopecten yessoensis]|uniref:Caspase-2 n=1 Tax=Mizuhopecten yessoensis TaxID=6573 RepID=A0A210QXY2_MIZYE|nr:death domain-containing protein CRADD-like [Mizuhopecten yessoensis]XP_021346862.1 death domain-containing protein CRADD-like [Mizuhopecten yessoensis]OWF53617.1 Caspase-2 [Mizuhopecten yessoensis]